MIGANIFVIEKFKIWPKSNRYVIIGGCNKIAPSISGIFFTINDYIGATTRFPSKHHDAVAPKMTGIFFANRRFMMYYLSDNRSNDDYGH